MSYMFLDGCSIQQPSATADLPLNENERLEALVSNRQVR
jgi:hypothetical protein